MSKGTPITTVRLDPLTRSSMERVVMRRNSRHRKCVYTLSDFIEQACRDLLHKLRRCGEYHELRRKLKSFHLSPEENDMFTPSETPHVHGETPP